MTFLLGKNRDLFYWNILFWSCFENHRIGICFTQWFISTKPLECHGFCCRRHWVWQFQRILFIISFYLINFSLVTMSINKNSSFNLRTLRAVRVLRPLKLVSGIPSKNSIFSKERKKIDWIACFSFQKNIRSSSGAEIDFESHGSIVSNRSSRSFCYCHFCHYRSGIVFRRVSYDLLLCKSNRLVTEYIDMYEHGNDRKWIDFDIHFLD